MRSAPRNPTYARGWRMGIEVISEESGIRNAKNVITALEKRQKKYVIKIVSL